MKLLFVADPLEGFKTYKDSTFAMLREAAARGHALYACEPRHLLWQRGRRVGGQVGAITLTGHADACFTPEAVAKGAETAAALADFDGVVMRKDPPFDSEYFYATHLLEQAE